MKRFLTPILVLMCLTILSLNVKAQETASKSELTESVVCEILNSLAAVHREVAPVALRSLVDFQDKLDPDKQDSLYYHNYVNTIYLYARSGQYQDAIQSAKEYISKSKGTKYEIDGYFNLCRLYVETRDFQHADSALNGFYSLCTTPRHKLVYLYWKQERLFLDESITLGREFIDLCKEIIDHPESSFTTDLKILDNMGYVCELDDFTYINSKLDQIIEGSIEPVSIMFACWQRYLNSKVTSNNYDIRYLYKIIDIFNSYRGKQIANKTSRIGKAENKIYEFYMEALFELASHYFNEDLALSYSYLRKVYKLFDKESYIKDFPELRLEYLGAYYRVLYDYYICDLSKNYKYTLDYPCDIATYIKNYRLYCNEFAKHIQRRLGHLTNQERYDYLTPYYTLIDDILYIESELNDLLLLQDKLDFKFVDTTNINISDKSRAFNLCTTYKGLVMGSYLQLGTDRLTIHDTTIVDIPTYEDCQKWISQKEDDSCCLFYVKHIVQDNQVNKNSYGVFVFGKGYETPRYFKLGLLDEIIEVADDEERYNTSTIYDAIIAPVSEHIANVKNLYIVPDGSLCSINLSALMNSQGERLYQTYNINLLSDIRELQKDNKHEILNSAVLYGGLHYNSRIQNVKSPNTPSEAHYRHTYIPDTLCRAGISYLPHSKKEVDLIKDILKKKRVKVYLHTKRKGTEESFKNLSKKSPSIIHIATHGFYYTPNASDISEIERYESGMLRSGLIMSGGGDTLAGQTDYMFDDGLLLADEIAHLDLSNTKVVVLSACNTGLGDTTTEGLIGLQRAFKLAGAKTLIMSLWPVNDYVTEFLMTKFYSYLSANSDIKESFYHAIQDCRIKYNHPRLWAPFIIVD